MKKILLILGAVVLVVAGVAAAYALYVKHEGRDVEGSSTVEFVTTTTPPPVKPPRKPPPVNETVDWPTFGYDNQRVRYDPAVRLRPPFKAIWTFHGHALLEFPPALAYGRVFLPTFTGRLDALDAKTGKLIWRRKTGRCGWSSPAVSAHVVFVTFIGHPSCDDPVPGTDGEVMAFSASHGRVVWRHTIGPTESSPLVAGGLVYAGDWNGKIWALDERTGRTRWTYQTGGKVKGSLALAGGHVFIGSYDGHVYSLDARTGKLAWEASAQPRLGSPGTFYSTPALAYGRVYIGSTDGKVYSFGATSGKLRWSHGTGGYVYGSPAVWRGLVLVGSYDSTFYALDAATGDERWSFHANGPISGSATVVAGIVYFSTFEKRTYALNARTGKLLWTFPDGRYTPVVADPARLYLVGLGELYALVQRR